MQVAVRRRHAAHKQKPRASSEEMEETEKKLDTSVGFVAGICTHFFSPLCLCCGLNHIWFLFFLHFQPTSLSLN